LIERTTDTPVISAEVEHCRDRDTLTDMLGYRRLRKRWQQRIQNTRSLPARNIYISRTHAKAARPAMHSGVLAWISPLRRPGTHHSCLPLALMKHLRTEAHSHLVRVAAHRFLSCRYMFPPRAPEGHPLVPVPDSALSRVPQRQHCPTQFRRGCQTGNLLPENTLRDPAKLWHGFFPREGGERVLYNL
jgi:hypothetical protein